MANGREKRLRRRTWGETVRIEGHLRGGKETQCNGNFLKYMKASLGLMKSLRSLGDRMPTGNLLLPNEASGYGTGLYLIELLAKGIPWASPNNSGCFQDSKLLSTN